MVDSRTKHQTHFNLTQPPFGAQFFPYSCLRKYQVKLVGLISLSFYIRWLFLDEMNYLGFKPFCWWWIEKEAIESNLHSHRKTQFFSTQFRMEHCPHSHFCVTHIANASPIDTQKHPLFFRLLFVVYSCTCDHMVLQKNSNYAACLVGSLGDTVEYSGLE